MRKRLGTIGFRLNEEHLKLIRTADRIHRFPAKMSPRLAYLFLAKISTKDQEANGKIRFCDPMCGSGTIALAARTLGFSSYAADIMYPAFIITSAKIHRLSSILLSDLGSASESIQVSEKRKPLWLWENWQIWHRQNVIRALQDIGKTIFEFRSRRFFPHLVTAFFQTIWDTSSADPGVIVPTRSGFSPCSPWLSSKRVLSVFRSRLQRVLEAQTALAALEISSGVPDVRQSNAIDEDSWPSSKFEIILTSPPYGCGIDYERAFRLQMRLWNHFVDRTQETNLQLLGRRTNLNMSHEVNLPNSEQDSKWFRRVRNGDPDRVRMFLQYLHDLRLFVLICSRRLSRYGRLGLVVGEPQIARTTVPLERIVTRFAEDAGLTLDEPPQYDMICTRIQNFRLRSASSPIGRECLLTFKS